MDLSLRRVDLGMQILRWGMDLVLRVDLRLRGVFWVARDKVRPKPVELGLMVGFKA